MYNSRDEVEIFEKTPCKVEAPKTPKKVPNILRSRAKSKQIVIKFEGHAKKVVVSPKNCSIRKSIVYSELTKGFRDKRDYTITILL